MAVLAPYSIVHFTWIKVLFGSLLLLNDMPPSVEHSIEHMPFLMNANCTVDLTCIVCTKNPYLSLLMQFNLKTSLLDPTCHGNNGTSVSRFPN